jgi:FkbM family methyltransferase
MYYSQQGEDKFIFENFLKHENGFFIELGAMDGVQYSNTLFFEKTLGWNGILIEPTNQYNNLMKNRPNCYNFNYAISQLEGEVEFVGNGALGGIKAVMPDGHYFGWGLNNEQIYKVPTIPISKIIDRVNNIKKIDKVDLFSIDVEGAELEVLKTYDWSIPTFLVLIEMAAYDLEKNDMCRKILLDNNFEFKSVIGCNEIWTNKNIKYE